LEERKEEILNGGVIILRKTGKLVFRIFLVVSLINIYSVISVAQGTGEKIVLKKVGQTNICSLPMVLYIKGRNHSHIQKITGYDSRSQTTSVRIAGNHTYVTDFSGLEILEISYEDGSSSTNKPDYSSSSSSLSSSFPSSSSGTTATPGFELLLVTSVIVYLSIIKPREKLER
jgi:hypothetical protein